MAAPARPSQHEVTQLLEAVGRDDGEASAALLPLVYNELRRLARAQIRREHAPLTLQPTALVHEAYLRLVGDGDVKWANRAHFFAAGARAMRHILVERARRRGRVKHGGERYRVELADDRLAGSDAPMDLVALDGALEKLEALHPRKTEIVMLRFFAGLSLDETAAALAVSVATVKSDWMYARAWLRRELDRADGRGDRP